MRWNGSSFTTKRDTAKGDLPLPYNDAVAWLAQWILLQKRARRPGALYCFGIQGSLGRGKSTFSRHLEAALNARVQKGEGRALMQSLDDYYLPRAVRNTPEFRARGYNPVGISNRGPAGTHDLHLLTHVFQALDRHSTRTSITLPVFDKRTDDRQPRGRRIQDVVGILIFEGWFVGAVPARRTPRRPGLKRSAMRALRLYQPIFRRLDDLLVFDAPSRAQIISERNAQERALGRRGMNIPQIQDFVRYFYEESWPGRASSPVPPRSRISLRAAMDPRRAFIRYFGA